MSVEKYQVRMFVNLWRAMTGHFDEERMKAAYLRAKVEGRLPEDACGIGKFLACNGEPPINICHGGKCMFAGLYVVLGKTSKSKNTQTCYHITSLEPFCVVNADNQSSYNLHKIEKIL